MIYKAFDCFTVQINCIQIHSYNRTHMFISSTHCFVDTHCQSDLATLH